MKSNLSSQEHAQLKDGNAGTEEVQASSSMQQCGEALTEIFAGGESDGGLPEDVGGTQYV